MPRKSQAAKLVQTPLVEQVRPDIPFDLTEEEGLVWRAVIDALPPDWFNPANEPLLTRYCKQIVTARLIDTMLAAEKMRRQPNKAMLLKLAKAQMSATTQIARLSTKMRIAQQSVYHPVTAAKQTARQASGGGVASALWAANEAVMEEAGE